MGFWDNKVSRQVTQGPEPVAQAPSTPWYQLTTTPEPTARAVAARLPENVGDRTARTIENQRAHSGHCPHCDGPNYLDISNHAESKLPMGAPHIYRCFDCGYPKTQTGTGTGGGFGMIKQPVAAEGPVRAARQLPTSGFTMPTSANGLERIG